MTDPRPFSVVISSLLAIALLAHPSSFAAAETERPKEPPQNAGPAEHPAQLRKEVEMLRQRIERLEKMRATAAPERHDGDPGGKEQMLTETRQILTHFHDAKAAAWKQAHGKIRALRVQLAASLTVMQDASTRRAMLDDAVAIRDAICFIKDPARSVLTDPGVLRNACDQGRILFFRVTGTNSGSLYGTDIYTSDSSLATAAVHAGILKIGQTGVVKVTTFPNHTGFVSSTRNGIASSNWSSHPAFRVEALGDEDQDMNDPDLATASPDAAPRTPDTDEGPKREEAIRPSIVPPGTPSPQPASFPPDLPAALPTEARELIYNFSAATADIRNGAKAHVAQLTRETVDRLTPIQDAHTRAARLDEAVALRDTIRKLTECTDKP